MSIWLAQLVQIAIMFRILRNIDKTDFSKEDEQVRGITARLKKSDTEISEAINQVEGK